MERLDDVKTIIDFLGEKNMDRIKNELTDFLIENLKDSKEYQRLG